MTALNVKWHTAFNQARLYNVFCAPYDAGRHFSAFTSLLLSLSHEDIPNIKVLLIYKCHEKNSSRVASERGVENHQCGPKQGTK